MIHQNRISETSDMGVDGRIFPVSSSAAPRKQQEGELGLKERWYPIQVKQKWRHCTSSN
jgi:hypothetical protein